MADMREAGPIFFVYIFLGSVHPIASCVRSGDSSQGGRVQSALVSGIGTIGWCVSHADKQIRPDPPLLRSYGVAGGPQSHGLQSPCLYLLRF